MKRGIAASAVSAVLVLGLTCGMAQAKSDVIKIGYFNWTDNIFTTNVVNYIITKKMGLKTDMTMANPAPVFQGVARGDFDFHTDAWLPKTHADYYKKYMGKIYDVGPIYTGARLGWVVPDYIPKGKLNSIEDLKSKDVMKKLDGKIIGIGSGAGLTRLSKQVMKDYGLSDFGYKLVISSGPGMTAALQKAEKKHEWIVVTGWSPHWMFGRWDLRYIEDPKGTLGGNERADIVVHRGFYGEHPKVFEMLDRITIPLDDVQKGQYRGEQTNYKKAAKEYVESHPDLVHYWVTGEMPK